MSWATSAPFLATLVLPAPWMGAVAIFLLTAAVVWWLITRTDRIIHHIFPDLAWEHSLGWLNIKAERRANTAMRWVRFGIHVLLFDALVVMLWTAKDFPPLQTWSDPWETGDLAWRVPMLALCFIIWVLFLGCGLLPKIRAERELAAFKKFRVEMEEEEWEKEMVKPKSRVHSPLPKPRTNPSLTPTTSNRMRRFQQPGG